MNCNRSELQSDALPTELESRFPYETSFTPCIECFETFLKQGPTSDETGAKIVIVWQVRGAVR